jgi:hypothetical protein
MIGNAVPVSLAYAIAKEIKRQMGFVEKSERSHPPLLLNDFVVDLIVP